MILELWEFISSVGHSLRYFDELLKPIHQEARIDVWLSVTSVLVVQNDSPIGLKLG